MAYNEIKNLIAKHSPPISSGTAGKILKLINELTEIQSDPPSGKKKITNIFWDPDTKEIVIEHE